MSAPKKQLHAFQIPIPGEPHKRTTIRLSGVNQKGKEEIKRHVTHLASATRYGLSPEAETVKWLSRLAPGRLRDQLVRLRLCDPLPQCRMCDLWPKYLDGRVETCGERTLTRIRQAERLAKDYFGPEADLREWTEEDAKAFRRYLLVERATAQPKQEGRPFRRPSCPKNLRENTVRKRCSDLRSLWDFAAENGLKRKDGKTANPFAAVPCRVVGKLAKPRSHVDDATARAILAACDDPETAALFATARWGGLRIPSETTSMRWDHMDWDRGEVQILGAKKPKAEVAEDGEAYRLRRCPLFPEWREAMLAWREACGPGEALVFPRHARVAGSALRKPLLKAIRRAGIEPWPGLYQELRRSRVRELRRRFSPIVVSQWLGHTEKVADEFYDEAIDEDHALALQASSPLLLSAPAAPVGNERKSDEATPEIPEASPPTTAEGGAKGDAAGAGTARQGVAPPPFDGTGRHRKALSDKKIAPAGLEPALDRF